MNNHFEKPDEHMQYLSHAHIFPETEYHIRILIFLDDTLHVKYFSVHRMLKNNSINFFYTLTLSDHLLMYLLQPDHFFLDVALLQVPLY